MSFIAAAIIGGAGLVGGIGSALISGNAAQQAAGQQVAFGQQALAQQKSLFGVAQGNLQPYIDQGTRVGTTLEKFTTPGPALNDALSQLPGFQFANKYGQIAATNQGTTMGLGGNTVAAGAEFATGLAQKSWLDYLGPLLAQYQTGANSAGALAGTAGTFSGQEGNTLTGIGSATASGTLGAANAYAGAVGGLGNTTANALLLGKYLNSSNTGPPGQYSYPNSPFTSAYR